MGFRVWGFPKLRVLVSQNHAHVTLRMGLGFRVVRSYIGIS